MCGDDVEPGGKSAYWLARGSWPPIRLGAAGGADKGTGRLCINLSLSPSWLSEKTSCFLGHINIHLHTSTHMYSIQTCILCSRFSAALAGVGAPCPCPSAICIQHGGNMFVVSSFPNGVPETV